jgi:hypothetical protein
MSFTAGVVDRSKTFFTKAPYPTVEHMAFLDGSYISRVK